MPNTINIDDIAVIGERIPAGTDYHGKLTACEGKLSRNNKPCVYATFEVIKGEHEGKEATAFYSLSVTKGKDGRLYGSGIVEMKRIFAAIGKPLPAGFQFPTDPVEAQRLFQKRLLGVSVKFAVIEEKDRTGALDDNGNVKVFTRTKVLSALKDVNEPHPIEAPLAAVADEYDA